MSRLVFGTKMVSFSLRERLFERLQRILSLFHKTGKTFEGRPYLGSWGQASSGLVGAVVERSLLVNNHVLSLSKTWTGDFSLRKPSEGTMAEGTRVSEPGATSGRFSLYRSATNPIFSATSSTEPPNRAPPVHSTPVRGDHLSHTE